MRILLLFAIAITFSCNQNQNTEENISTSESYFCKEADSLYWFAFMGSKTDLELCNDDIISIMKSFKKLDQ